MFGGSLNEVFGGDIWGNAGEFFFLWFEFGYGGWSFDVIGLIWLIFVVSYLFDFLFFFTAVENSTSEATLRSSDWERNSRVLLIFRWDWTYWDPPRGAAISYRLCYVQRCKSTWNSFIAIGNTVVLFSIHLCCLLLLLLLLTVYSLMDSGYCENFFFPH